jgi:LysR family glycine cleavage system transcriptional activator
MLKQNTSTGYQLPPLAWLRAFEAAARHASFTAAAAELNLTQAAVSHQVRSLEKHLGVVLFERLARTLRLTEMGSAYLPPLRRAFEDLTAATAGLFGQIGQCTLTISAPVSFIALWLAPRLAGFRQLFPQISLRLTSAVWAHSPDEAAFDLDIRFGDGVWPGQSAELLANFPAVVVCRPGRVPHGDAAQRVAALAQDPLIHVTGYEDLWQRLFQQHGVGVPPVRSLDVDTTLAALELAASGYGPTIVLEGLAAPYLQDGRLALALEGSLPIEGSHYLVTPQGERRKRPETTLFQAWLKEQARLRSDAHPLIAQSDQSD